MKHTFKINKHGNAVHKVTLPPSHFEGMLWPREQLPLHQLIMQGQEESALLYIEKSSATQPVYAGDSLVDDFSEFKITESNLNPNALLSSVIYITFNGDEDNIVYFSKDPNSIFAQDKNRVSALHLAVEYNMPTVIMALLHRGMNINIWDTYGDTPLSIAVKKGHAPIIRLLIQEGACPTHRTHDLNQTLTEVLNKKKDFPLDIFELLVHPDPLKTERKNYKTNELHLAIIRLFPDKLVLSLAKHPHFLIPNEKGQLPSVLARHCARITLIPSLIFKEKYSSLLLYSFKYIHGLPLRSGYSNNVIFLNLAFKTLCILQEYISHENKIDDDYQENIMNALFLFATCIFNINYKLRDTTNNHIPWKNLCALRNIIESVDAEDKIAIGLFSHIKKGFLQEDLPVLINDIEKLLRDHEHWHEYDTGNIAQVKPISSFTHVYCLTEPIMVQRTLKKLETICTDVSTFSPDSLEGRYGIFRALKILCELTLYTQTSRNLSPLLKSYIALPYRHLALIRKQLAKNKQWPSVHHHYEKLLTGEDSSVFENIQKNMTRLIQPIRNAMEAHDKYLGETDPKDYNFMEEKIILPQDEQNNLKQDLIAYYNSKNTNARKKTNKLFRDCQDCVNKNFLNSTQIKTIETFFAGSKVLHSKYKKLFNNLKKNLEGDFKDFLAFNLDKPSPEPLPAMDYRKTALALIKRLEKILIEDPIIVKAIHSIGPDKDYPRDINAFLTERMKIYARNIALRFACEQIIADLALTLNQISIPYNKKFRHYLEHLDITFDTSHTHIERGNFQDILYLIVKVKGGLKKPEAHSKSHHSFFSSISPTAGEYSDQPSCSSQQPPTPNKGKGLRK